MDPARLKRFHFNFLHGNPQRIHACVPFLLLALALHAHAVPPICFHTDHPGYVSLNLYRADGALVRQLLSGKRFAAGNHKTAWDGLDNGAPLPSGDYTWRAVIHDGLALRLRGWVGDWGGDRGVPSAAAADDAKIYLGWSLASANSDAVVACDPAGVIRWTHRRGALSGCRALAVDAGTVFVLGGEAADAEGGALYKLRAKDGAPIPWPNGRADLAITSLWPADHKDSPARADYLAVKNGRIYLSFTAGNFISVLDAKTGAYLQTIVGSPPGAIDSVGTKTDTPEKPNVLVDADFVVTALKGGTIGKLLLVHDPIWLVASDLTPTDGDQSITALSMIGDGAKHHMHDIFVALGSPSDQVQARSALDSDVITYVAGKVGGRAPHGAWQPDRMSDIRALALDATGQLWVAEGAAVPKRISVWTTAAAEGRLVHEFFAPPDSGSPAAIHPSDPRLMYAGGCEWRINSGTGRAACLGIVTGDPVRAARFVIENDRVLLVLTPRAGAEIVLERVGDGDYRPHIGPVPEATPSKIRLLPTPGGSWQLTTVDGYALGAVFGSAGEKPRASIAPPPGEDWRHLSKAPGMPTLTEMPDGKVFLTAGQSRVWNLELTGLETLRPLASGKITIPQGVR